MASASSSGDYTTEEIDLSRVALEVEPATYDAAHVLVKHLFAQRKSGRR